MNTPTRITVIGPGAIGGVIASQLQRSGTELNVLATPRSAPRLREAGLRVVDNGELHVCHPRVTDDAAELGVQDIVLICTKSHALTAAARGLAPLIGPDTVIVPALNGIPWWFFEGFGGNLQDKRLLSVDPTGDIARFLPPGQCVGCVVYLASWVDADGVVHPGPGRRFVLGDPVPDRDTNRVAHVAQLLESASFEVKRATDIRREVWLKLWGNATMNPISALTGATIDRLVRDAHTRQLAVSIMDEARAIALGLGIELPMTNEQRLAELDALGPIKTSMLQDLAAGRAPEVDAIVGAVAEIGDLLDVDTPFVDAMLGLVRQLAVSRLSQRAP